MLRPMTKDEMSDWSGAEEWDENKPPLIAQFQDYTVIVDESGMSFHNGDKRFVLSLWNPQTGGLGGPIHPNGHLTRPLMWLIGESILEYLEEQESDPWEIVLVNDLGFLQY